MAESSEKVNFPLFANPLETFPGLTIDDLNKYLPAINKIEDLSMTANQMRDGIFLGLAIDGIKKYLMIQLISLLLNLQNHLHKI